MEDQKEYEATVPMKNDLPVAKAPMDIIQLAITQGADLEKLEKLMELQERYRDSEAKKKYTEAMAAFKADAPEIEKDRRVKYQTSKGVTEYAHATLANVTDKINKSLSTHGLSAAWSTRQEGDNITVTCTITHWEGHSQSTSLTAKPDLTGSKNPIQAIGSTISYLERYTLLALTGLATHDMDDDTLANTAQNKITEQQLADINTLKEDLIKAKKIKGEDDFQARLKRLFNTEILEDLTEKQASKLILKMGLIK